MRKPQGYLQVFCDDPTNTGVTDRYGRAVAAESDTFGCVHCSEIVVVRPGERPEDLGGMCHVCMGLMCPRCTNVDGCSPLEKRLEAQERRYDTLRSYGLA